MFCGAYPPGSRDDFIRSSANSLAKGDWWVYSFGLYLCSIISMLIVPPEV